MNPARTPSPVVVVDETRVRVKGKDAWIYVALDPRTSRVTYLEPFFRRDEYTTDLFSEHPVEGYGKWPREVITDGGSWYRAAFSFWQIEGRISWKVVRGGERSVTEASSGSSSNEGSRTSTSTSPQEAWRA